MFICSFRCESLLRRRGASGFGENEGRFDPADIFSFDYFFYLFGFALFPPLPLPLPPPNLLSLFFSAVFLYVAFFPPMKLSLSLELLVSDYLFLSFFLSFFLCLAFLFLFLCVCYLSSPSVLLTCRVDQCCHCRSNVLDRIRSLWCTGRGWRRGVGREEGILR